MPLVLSVPAADGLVDLRRWSSTSRCRAAT